MSQRLETSAFDYILPPELIATVPAAHREESRLMVVHRDSGQIEHRVFRDLPSYFTPDDLLVLNDTRVRPSLMKSEDGTLEILLLEETSPQHWVVLVKPGKKARPGMLLKFEKGLQAEVLRTLEGGERVLRFFQPFDVHEAAQMPLPPYILKQREKLGAAQPPCDDRERYQTVYAREEKSVAAPTAGLHFTPEILAKLNHTFLTLEVGLGTFRPVKTKFVEEHEMHWEHFIVPKGLAEKVASAKRLVAVGTTSVRVLESVDDLSPRRSRTNIFIYPPYKFKRVQAMVTNFHLPHSTLLMLVCAFGGYELMMRAYREAIAEKYRFYSYGDAMLIL
jgi:S-adenosylmethionine:tRNA ribosyltransferase-isomerase